MQRRVLALFARAPLPGRVKTRLVPPLTPEEAAALYEAMLRDILDQHAAPEPWERALWFTPPEAEAWFRRAAPPVYRLYAQTGPDLPQRMRALFEGHAAEGCDRIVLRGTDSPTLPLETVEAAFDALERADVVLSPDRDGGYNLIGLREPVDALFDLEMSTAAVLDGTVSRARALGLRVHLLPGHHDVDTAPDLALLAPEVSEERTPRTARWLREARASINA